jgi:MFS-type transporter involved in bile tolerance (Atg22 family)
MDLKKLKTVKDKMLRGGMCAVWITAFLLMFYEFLFAATADTVQEQATFYARMLICAGCGILAAFSHAYLMHIAGEEKT